MNLSALNVQPAKLQASKRQSSNSRAENNFILQNEARKSLLIIVNSGESHGTIIAPKGKMTEN